MQNRGKRLFANVAALHDALLDKEPRSFVSHHIFERVPFAFGSDRSLWIEWKRTLSDLIDVDPQDIVMTGSAAVGFSLNPYKGFKSFDENSDFDCGIISDHYFDVAWRYLRQLRVSWLSLPSKSREAIKSHRKNHVFAGTIAADSMLALLPFGQNWQAALDKMALIDPTKGREVKLRIYRDYESLRYYQANGVERLRDKISENQNPDIAIHGNDEIITIEDDL